MNVKVIMIPYTFKGKDGKDHKSYNYALELENGKRILINPVVIREKDKEGKPTDKVLYDGKSDLSLIASVVEK